MQGRDDSKQASASTAPCPEPEKQPSSQASDSKPPQSTSDPPSLEKSPPTTAPEPASPHVDLSGEEDPLQSIKRSAEAVVDEVLMSAKEILSAPDSPQKEFHCAVLRALSKEPVVGAERAPGTRHEVELPLKSGPTLPSPFCSGSTLGVGEPLPAVSSHAPQGLESAAIVLPSYPQFSLQSLA